LFSIDEKVMPKGDCFALIKALMMETEIHSVLKLPDIRANEGVDSSRKINYKMSLMME